MAQAGSGRSSGGEAVGQQNELFGRHGLLEIDKDFITHQEAPQPAPIFKMMNETQETKMPINAHRNDFPENVPTRLIRALRQAGSERKLSRLIGVNILYVSQLLRDGKEPTDQTENGQAVRVALFLPKMKRKPRVKAVHPDQLTPEWWNVLRKKAVNQLARATRKALKL